ncbi:MAG TPA: LpqB family beta-propeller domain-containing protein [Microlunatus sp.]
MRIRRWRPALAVVTVLLVLAGCVAVPTSGPVERIAGGLPECTNCVDVVVAPPAFADTPQQIVEGYLRANSNFQPAYSVARQFLTEAAAGRWSPEAGARIYRGNTQADGDRVTLNGRLVGLLGSDRTYTPQDRALRVDFGLVKENGQWRISKPPNGLLVADFAFDSFYLPFNLYFVGNGRSLVPDPIYLPTVQSPAGLASVLMRALLGGASDWLKPAVTTAIPADTALSVDSVTVSGGVADIPLNDVVLGLNDAQRSLMAAQVAYTLESAEIGIRAVRFTVNGQPYPIPGGNPDTFEVSKDANFGELNPIPVVAGDQLYAMRRRGVEQVNPASDVPDAKPMPGAFGRPGISVQSMGVSLGGTDLVAVTDNGTVLRRGTTAGGTVTDVPLGASGLIRPQFSRFGEIWAIGEEAGQQRLWVIEGRKRTEVATDVLKQGRVVAFKISPDGSRIGLVRDVNGKTELGLLRIVRSDRVTVDGWRPLQVNRTSAPKESTPNLTRVVDVAWANATDLIVLAGPSGNVPLAPYRIRQDALTVIAEGEANNWDAVALTVSLATQASIVVGRDQQTWRDSGSQWVAYLDGVRAIAYPG